MGLHAPCVGCVGEAAYHPWTLVQESARTDHLRHTGRHAAAAIRSSVFTGPPAVPGEHSSKPDEVRDWIAAAYPDCGQLELFARTAAPGWERWGNQAPYQASLTWAVRKTGSTMRKWLNASGKQAPGAASQKPSSAVRLQPNHQLSRSPAKVNVRSDVANDAGGLVTRHDRLPVQFRRAINELGFGLNLAHRVAVIRLIPGKRQRR